MYQQVITKFPVQKKDTKAFCYATCYTHKITVAQHPSKHLPLLFRGQLESLHLQALHQVQEAYMFAI
jgi:hypothetical protein